MLLIKQFRWKIKSQPLNLSWVFTSKLSGLLDTASWHAYKNPSFRHLSCKPSSPRKHRGAVLPHMMLQMHNPTGILSRPHLLGCQRRRMQKKRCLPLKKVNRQLVPLLKCSGLTGLSCFIILPDFFFFFFCTLLLPWLKSSQL